MGCTASALQFKNPIGSVDSADALAKLEMLHPSNWTFKDAKRFDALEHVSLYADDVERMDPRCVTYDQEGAVHDYWDRCVLAYTIAAVKEQKREIDALRNR